MKTHTAPFRSQENRELGMFRANSLGESVQQANSKPLDMVVAKSIIRRQRSGFKRKVKARALADAKLKRTRAWWYCRRTWKSVTVKERLGKLNPNIRRRVEFPDGSLEWLPIE